jgi:hypothetical protein
VPRTEARINLVALLLLAFLFVFLKPVDISSVARLVAISYVLLALVGLHFATALAGTTWASIVAVIRHSVLASGISLGAGLAARYLSSSLPLGTRTVVVALVFGGAYCSLLWILDRQIFVDARRLLLYRNGKVVAQSTATDE